MADRISLGLDIGVASVGFSVLDIDKGKVIELGARLFSATVAAGNQDRRDMRGARRLLNRNKQRRQDTGKLFKKFGLCEVGTSLILLANNPLCSSHRCPIGALIYK